MNDAPTKTTIGDQEFKARSVGVIRVKARGMQECSARVALTWLDPERETHGVVSRESRETCERHAAVAIEGKRAAEFPIPKRDLAELLGAAAIGGCRRGGVDGVGRATVLKCIKRVLRRGCWKFDDPCAARVIRADLTRGVLFSRQVRALCIEHRCAKFIRALRGFVACKPYKWRRCAKRVRVRLQTVFVDLSEHGREAVELARWNWVVLVIVAAGALEREPEEGRAKGRHAISDRFLAEFLGNRAAFFRHAMEPVECARDRKRLLLSVRRGGQEITSDQGTRELVVRHVALERVEQPIAPRPCERVAVGLVAEGVCKAREIKPHGRAMFGGAWSREHRVDAAFVRVGQRIGDERVDLFRRRWEPSQRK